MPEARVLKPGTILVLPHVRVKTKTLLSPKLQKLQLQKLEPTSSDVWRKAIGSLDKVIAEKLLKSRFWEQGEEIVLSARTPVHENRGHIEGYQIQTYAPSQPAIWFVWQSGKLYIWLNNLDQAGTYVMEIRCSAYNGSLHIGASDAPHMDMPAQGQDHRIWVVIDKPDYDMSLVTIEGYEVDNWCFYDARVWRVT